MITLLAVVVAWSAAIFGYGKARGFVRDRLRYVEAVHKPFVPFKVGFLAMLATLPVAVLMPVITGASALLFGTAVGLGVAAGRKDIRTRRYLSA
jgi:hypothetical protein